MKQLNPPPPLLYNFRTQFPVEVFIKARRPKLVFPRPAADGRMALGPLRPPPWTGCGRGGERGAACWPRRPPSGCAPPLCCSRAGFGPLQRSRYQICMMDNRHQISGKVFFLRLVVKIWSSVEDQDSLNPDPDTDGDQGFGWPAFIKDVQATGEASSTSTDEISSESGSRYGWRSRVRMTSLYKGRPSYRRSFQHFERWNFINCFLYFRATTLVLKHAKVYRNNFGKVRDQKKSNFFPISWSQILLQIDNADPGGENQCRSGIQ